MPLEHLAEIAPKYAKYRMYWKMQEFLQHRHGQIFFFFSDLAASHDVIHDF